MKLLVLDSSGLVASVALIEDDQLIAEYTTGNKLTHSQTLLPMLDEVIKRTSFEIEDIDAVRRIVTTIHAIQLNTSRLKLLFCSLSAFSLLILICP